MKPTEEQWPEDATHKINGVYVKWIDGVEYNTDSESHTWDRRANSWSLDEYHLNKCRVIERPAEPAPYMPEVGAIVEVLISDKWVRAVVYGIGEYGECLAKADGYCYDEYKSECVRPVKSEREKFIEKALVATGAPKDLGDMFGTLYDAGFKAPEVV